MLSIVIPTLNEEDYLPLLLESIKKQDLKDYEIIIADAASKDKTVEIARHYGCKIVPGGLPAKARNSGAAAAKGEILLFLDADVVLPLDFLKKSLEDFNKRKLGIAGFLIKPLKGKKIDRLIYFLFDTFVFYAQKFFTHSASATMVKKTVHDSIKGFDETVKLVEDYCYAKSASKISKYGCIKQYFFVAMRRYEKDGRFTYAKYALAVLYTIFFGPIRSDLFRYQFGYRKNQNETKK